MNNRNCKNKSNPEMRSIQLSFKSEPIEKTSLATLTLKSSIFNKKIVLFKKENNEIMNLDAWKLMR